MRHLMSFAYADPPYLGCCALYNHNHPPGPRPFDGRCWNDPETHRLLFAWLAAGFDGWAVSGTSGSLATLLPMVPRARVAAWAKTFCAFKRGVRPAYAWEPLIFMSRANPPALPHAPPEKGGKQSTPKDYFAGPITLKKGLTGAKSAAFCMWVLDLLNVAEGDDVLDVFPGTGIMGRVVRGEERPAAP